LIQSLVKQQAMMQAGQSNTAAVCVAWESIIKPCIFTKQGEKRYKKRRVQESGTCLWKAAAQKAFRLMSYSSWTQAHSSAMLQKGSANRRLQKENWKKNWKSTADHNGTATVRSKFWQWCRKLPLKKINQGIEKNKSQNETLKNIVYIVYQQ